MSSFTCIFTLLLMFFLLALEHSPALSDTDNKAKESRLQKANSVRKAKIILIHNPKKNQFQKFNRQQLKLDRTEKKMRRQLDGRSRNKIVIKHKKKIGINAYKRKPVVFHKMKKAHPIRKTNRNKKKKMVRFENWDLTMKHRIYKKKSRKHEQLKKNVKKLKSFKSKVSLKNLENEVNKKGSANTVVKEKMEINHDIGNKKTSTTNSYQTSKPLVQQGGITKAFIQVKVEPQADTNTTKRDNVMNKLHIKNAYRDKNGMKDRSQPVETTTEIYAVQDTKYRVHRESYKEFKDLLKEQDITIVQDSAADKELEKTFDARKMTYVAFKEIIQRHNIKNASAFSIDKAKKMRMKRKKSIESPNPFRKRFEDYYKMHGDYPSGDSLKKIMIEAEKERIKKFGGDPDKYSEICFYQMNWDCYQRSKPICTKKDKIGNCIRGYRITSRYDDSGNLLLDPPDYFEAALQKNIDRLHAYRSKQGCIWSDQKCVYFEKLLKQYPSLAREIKQRFLSRLDKIEETMALKTDIQSKGNDYDAALYILHNLIMESHPGECSFLLKMLPFLEDSFFNINESCD